MYDEEQIMSLIQKYAFFFFLIGTDFVIIKTQEYNC